MKKMGICLVALCMVLSLVACQSKQETGTLTGAALGGLLGSQFGGGSTKILTAVGGALVGGLIGGYIGKSMDQQDRINMQSAVANTPVDHNATWTNPKTNTTYVVTPTKNFNQGSDYCREYQTQVTVDGKTQKAYGTACRQPDGSWQLQS